MSPRTSGRLSHSSGPLNGSLSDSPPVSPSEMDDLKVLILSIYIHTYMYVIIYVHLCLSFAIDLRLVAVFNL